MKLLFSLVPLVLAACTTVSGAQAGPTAGIGGIAFTNGIRVQPLKIVEDSRCPAKVQCVWAGRLVLRAKLIGGGWQRDLDLTLGSPQQVADGKLTLVTAVPQKEAGAETDPRAYRFTFDFQGGL